MPNFQVSEDKFIHIKNFAEYDSYYNRYKTIIANLNDLYIYLTGRIKPLNDDSKFNNFDAISNQLFLDVKDNVAEPDAFYDIHVARLSGVKLNINGTETSLPNCIDILSVISYDKLELISFNYEDNIIDNMINDIPKAIKKYETALIAMERQKPLIKTNKEKFAAGAKAVTKGLFEFTGELIGISYKHTMDAYNRAEKEYNKQHKN